MDGFSGPKWYFWYLGCVYGLSIDIQRWTDLFTADEMGLGKVCCL